MCESAGSWLDLEWGVGGGATTDSTIEAVLFGPEKVGTFVTISPTTLCLERSSHKAVSEGAAVVVVTAGVDEGDGVELCDDAVEGDGDL